MFYQASLEPGHATDTSSRPVESSSPPNRPRRCCCSYYIGCEARATPEIRRGRYVRVLVAGCRGTHSGTPMHRAAAGGAGPKGRQILAGGVSRRNEATHSRRAPAGRKRSHTQDHSHGGWFLSPRRGSSVRKAYWFRGLTTPAKFYRPSGPPYRTAGGAFKRNTHKLPLTGGTRAAGARLASPDRSGWHQARGTACRQAVAPGLEGFARGRRACENFLEGSATLLDHDVSALRHSPDKEHRAHGGEASGRTA